MYIMLKTMLIMLKTMLNVLKPMLILLNNHAQVCDLYALEIHPIPADERVA